MHISTYTNMLINHEAGTKSRTTVMTSRRQDRARWRALHYSTTQYLFTPHEQSHDKPCPSFSSVCLYLLGLNSLSVDISS